MKRSRTVKSQMISAILMALAGTVLHAGSRSYNSPYDIPEPKPVRLAELSPPAVPAETEAEPIVPGDTIPETEAEEVVSPSLSALYLASLYPEGANEADAQESMAGRIIRELSVKDSKWLASIYELSGRKPEEAAAELGQPPDSVRGQYNPDDENQAEDNPESWTISEWSHIDMVFTDENGNRIMADSNIKEIMALANTYFYYTNPEDSGAFLEYAKQLWDQSHSVRYSVGEVYYCEGCLEEVSDTVYAEAEEDLADSAVETPAAEETAAVLAEGAAADTAVTASGDSVTGETAVASSEDSETGETMAEESVLAASSETAATEIGPGVLSEEQTKLAAAGRMETAAVEIGPGITLMEASRAAKVQQPEETEEEPQIPCPGHVDLHITATVTGLSDSKNSLFSKAEALGEKSRRSAFTGWNETNRNAAKMLAEQDWKALYGLTISSSYITNPLSQTEIKHYLSLLPADTSAERQTLIRCALSSVGKIPYYWGGKPSAPDYDGNFFGSLAAADEKGRIMKGLDCSGWISWVYWSALGKRLPAESTEGLSKCGTGVARKDLKPGDIIVRLGEEGHVVMFLAWESDGRMKVIHESSGSVNNVTVSTMEAGWPYYRKLID